MVQYPLQFEVSAEGVAGTGQAWSTRVPGHAPGEVREVRAAVPPEFSGPGGGFSPEDFYALALLNCFLATFQVIAEKSKLEFRGVRAKGVLTVDRNENGAPWMKHFLLSVEVEGAGDPDRATRLLEKTSQSCLILNSVKTEKTFKFEVLP